MLIREPLIKERDKFDAVATHPMQTWAWGEFRRQTGVDLLRLALFDGQHIVKSFQITIHSIPKLGWKLGYLPKSDQPDQAQLFALQTAAQKHHLVFVKNEPNVCAPATIPPDPSLQAARTFLTNNQHQAGRAMFTPHSFIMDLTQSEEQILANMKSKTRYNVRLAQKNQVQVVHDNSDQAFEEYINLMKQTTKRQAFYAHGESYHRSMWQHMRPADIAHLLKATYQGQTLGIWIVFVHNHTLYYPYGASSREHREVMANNLLAWEAIKFGKANNCTSFDMWGSLGPNPDKDDPWYGFHRFKAGYGAPLMEFIGSYDYVADPQKYQVYQFLDKWRWKYLRFRSKLPL